MNRFKFSHITGKLLLSFSLLIFILILFGTVSLYGVNTISRLTRTIYDHPLVVSNAALQTNILITRMHRDMKDVVLFKDPERVNRAIESVEQGEKQALHYLETIQSQILGEKGMLLEKKAKALFLAWRPIREEVIALVHQQKHTRAADITVGKGAAHVEKLEDVMGTLTHYARTKATEFMSQAEKTDARLQSATLLFLFSAIIISVLVALRTLKQTAAAEKEIQESRQLLVNAIDHASIGMVMVSPDGRFHKANQAFSEMTGYTEDELLGMTYQDITVPEDQSLGPKAIQDLIQGKIKKSGFEKKYAAKNGNIIHVYLTTSIVKDNKGTPLYFFTQCQDITERKKTERKLHYQQEQVQQYLNVAGVMLIALDPKGIVTNINPKGCEVLGASITEIVGKNWFDAFLPQENIEKVKTVFQQIITENIHMAEYYENKVIRKDGTERIIAWHNSILRDNAGQVIGTFSSGEDISQRTQAEKKLRDNEKKYRSLFQASSDAIIIVDVETMAIVDANDKALILYQYDYDMLLKMRAPNLSAEPEKTISSVNETQDQVVPLRYHRKKDGSVFPVEITASYFELNGRKICISAIRDISEIKKIERRLNQAQKMESIGTLAGGIAHDFNNILTSIIGFTELALDDVEKESVLESDLMEVYTAGIRAKELVKQILAYARQSSEEKKPIQVDVTVNEVLKLMRSSIPSTIEISQNIETNALIMGNPSQVHQIIMNLCTNAACAMEDQGDRLGVTLKSIEIDHQKQWESLSLKPGPYILLEVTDNGAGIPADIIGSIFDPYFTTKELGEGTGMGLAMVHGIVESYGGKITAESRVGIGSTFRVFFPVTNARTPRQMIKAEGLPMGSERILFVDDEAQVVRMAKKVLQQLGYTVTATTSSMEAMRLFQSSPNDFDLVITDMTMPKMTGDIMAGEMLAIRPDIPIILCTGYSKKISEALTAEIGIKAFVDKPVVKSDLANIIRRVLNGTV